MIYIIKYAVFCVYFMKMYDFGEHTHKRCHLFVYWIILLYGEQYEFRSRIYT